MSLVSEIILIEELCAATGKSDGWWMKNWLRAHVRDGFPRKLPMLWGWPRKAVEAWARRGGVMPPEPDNDDGFAAARSDLEARLGVRS